MTRHDQSLDLTSARESVAAASEADRGWLAAPRLSRQAAACRRMASAVSTGCSMSKNCLSCLGRLQHVEEWLRSLCRQLFFYQLWHCCAPCRQLIFDQLWHAVTRRDCVRDLTFAGRGRRCLDEPQLSVSTGRDCRRMDSATQCRQGCC